ncbi:MAG: TonB-dependent receptor [Prevotellaceae bacterium]|jgi:hypothetical protein|nr:TonB-dependent receptor [Prevotellaceae bacterium]
MNFGTTKLLPVFICLLALCAVHTARGQYSISGKILHKASKNPVGYANIVLADKGLWATTNGEGAFTIFKVPQGAADVTVSCLGFVKTTFQIHVTQDTAGIEWYLPEDNLKLDEVVVTAKRQDGMATSYVIDRTGLEHMQLLNVADAMSLLPGGKSTRSPHFAGSAPQTLAIRAAASGENGNPTFGTAIEVDGVRLSNNGTFDVSGADVRGIAASHVASIEVITGVPSVEYGDMSNGIVKIETKKGKSPWQAELSTKLQAKQFSLSKGFDMGRRTGVLNIGAEHTKSIAELASPFTSYSRNSLSAHYSNTLHARGGQSVRIESGVTGNIGGYDSKNDPDAFTDTYVKNKNNTLRGRLNVNWLLLRSWITSLEASGAVSYSDNLTEAKENKSTASSVAAIHGKDEGYFVGTMYDENPNAPIVLIPAGYWYHVRYNDSKPLDLTANVKARWTRRFGAVNSHLLLGADFSRSGNRGQGEYYADARYAPTYREYRYDQIPFMNNAGFYAEEKIDVVLHGQSGLQVVAGVREDMTAAAHSAYGTVSSLSPRVNAKYTFRGGKEQLVGKFAVRAGWGKAMKLPSFAVLYPSPAYTDKLAFAPGTLADGSIFYAYHIQPRTAMYNPDLRWQYNRLKELNVEAEIKGVTVSVSLFHNKTVDAYHTKSVYTPFAYKLTDQSNLEGSAVPSADRQYYIDRFTGVVTIHDKTGQHPDETAGYKEQQVFQSNNTYVNGSPSVRKGVEWTVDFGKIQPIRSTVRLDGNYYYYRGVDETVAPRMLSSQFMADGATPYQYIGFYAGGQLSSNGSESKQVNTNITFITHIPAIRLIVSLRIETTLYKYSQNLSESVEGQRSFALADRADFFPAADNPDGIYNSNRYVANYPLYYTTWNDMETKIPFAEKLAWAKDNDPALYNDLVKLVVKTTTEYYFNSSNISGYYSANISVTKEIGDFATLSFTATNFTNNMQLVTDRQNNTQNTLYRSTYIPQFYYGLSLKLKV